MNPGFYYRIRFRVFIFIEKLGKKWYIDCMLTFTHTYLLNLAFQKLHRKNIPLETGELILGNVIPDFISHLGRSQFQALAHNLSFYNSTELSGALEWGAIFHILCDNYSTLGQATFQGNYHNIPKNGFIEQLSQKVIINLAIKIPRRRILQCAFDILVIRDNRELLIKMLKAAESFLHDKFSEVTHRVSTIYRIDPNQLTIGLNRFSRIYGNEFVEQAASEEYRLFPLARSLLNLDSLTNPQSIMEGVRNHPELMELVESNMDLIKNDWQELLKDTVREVLKYPGLKEILFNIF